MRDSKGPVVALCVLKGGAAFYADLWQAISRINVDREKPVAVQVEFVRLRSYVDDHSTGTVTMTGLDADALRGKDVLSSSSPPCRPPARRASALRVCC